MSAGTGWRWHVTGHVCRLVSDRGRRRRWAGVELVGVVEAPDRPTAEAIAAARWPGLRERRVQAEISAQLDREERSTRTRPGRPRAPTVWRGHIPNPRAAHGG